MIDPIPYISKQINAPVHGEITVPGDKSLSHRALIFSALAKGTTKIEGLLEAEDVLNTAAALRALGADIRVQGQNETRQWTVEGCGDAGFKEPETILDMGNSGTAARLLCGLVAGQSFRSFISGDHSLNGRPMRRVMKPLSLMGADFKARRDEYLPLMVDGGEALKAITYESPVASAQIKSAILLASLKAIGTTTVIEPHLSRDHTERMGRAFGWHMDTRLHDDGKAEISAKGGQILTAPKEKIVIPSDPSSAAFPIAAALMIKGSDLTIKNVNINPTRIGFMLCVQDMGGQLEFVNEREQGGEPVADIHVRYSPDLKGIDVPLARVPSMIDEFPIFSVLASCASGQTTTQGLSELRVKESDRLSAMANGLIACGVSLEEGKEHMTINGKGTPPKGLDQGQDPIKTYYDHRIAMSFLVLGAVSDNPVIVDDISAIATSFPVFMELMSGLGLDLTPYAA